jgi:hypothetical protein
VLPSIAVRIGSITDIHYVHMMNLRTDLCWRQTAFLGRHHFRTGFPLNLRFCNRMIIFQSCQCRDVGSSEGSSTWKGDVDLSRWLFVRLHRRCDLLVHSRKFLKRKKSQQKRSTAEQYSFGSKPTFNFAAACIDCSWKLDSFIGIGFSSRVVGRQQDFSRSSILTRPLYYSGQFLSLMYLTSFACFYVRRISGLTRENLFVFIGKIRNLGLAC